MGTAYPIVVERWPVARPVWIAAEDGLRHWLPAGGGVIGVCAQVMPAPPVMAFLDADEQCCPACLRKGMHRILPTLVREMP